MASIAPDLTIQPARAPEDVQLIVCGTRELTLDAANADTDWPMVLPVARGARWSAPDLAPLFNNLLVLLPCFRVMA
jgi:hypothetical protein